MIKEITNLKSKRLQFKPKNSIIIEVHQDPDESFVATSWSHSYIGYGEGESTEQAIQDFCQNLEKTYFDHKQNKRQLGLTTQKEWKYLKSILKEI